MPPSSLSYYRNYSAASQPPRASSSAFLKLLTFYLYWYWLFWGVGDLNFVGKALGKEILCFLMVKIQPPLWVFPNTAIHIASGWVSLETAAAQFDDNLSLYPQLPIPSS